MLSLKNNKKIYTEYLPIIATAIAVAVTAIIFKQIFIKIAPLFVSLFVMLFNSRASRYGLLLGGINSFFYCFIHFFYYNLYTIAFSALFGGVMQISSFFMWKKKAYGTSTIFRKMNKNARIIGIILFTICWATVSYFLSKTEDAQLYVLDSFCGICGFVAPFLVLFRFTEYAFLNFMAQMFNMVLCALLAFSSVAEIPLVVFNVYCTYMCLKQTLRWIALYKEQQALKISENNN